MVADLLAIPDGVLLGSGEDGDGAGLVGVVGQGPVSVSVRAENVRQDEGVAEVGLLPGDGVPGSVAGGGQ